MGTGPAAAPAEATAPAAPPTLPGVIRYRIGGMDCGDCQHLVATELGKLSGVRLARVSQSPPETVVEYDPAKLDAKQIEGICGYRTESWQEAAINRPPPNRERTFPNRPARL